MKLGDINIVDFIMSLIRMLPGTDLLVLQKKINDLVCDNTGSKKNISKEDGLIINLLYDIKDKEKDRLKRRSLSCMITVIKHQDHLMTVKQFLQTPKRDVLNWYLAGKTNLARVYPMIEKTIKDGK